MNPTSRCLLMAGLFAAMVAPAFAKIERVVEKSFIVQPGGNLQVETQGGNIQVQPSTDNVAKVIAKQKINANSDAEADEILQKLTLGETDIPARSGGVDLVANFSQLDISAGGTRM